MAEKRPADTDSSTNPVNEISEVASDVQTDEKDKESELDQYASKSEKKTKFSHYFVSYPATLPQ